MDLVVESQFVMTKKESYTSSRVLTVDILPPAVCVRHYSNLLMNFSHLVSRPSLAVRRTRTGAQVASARKNANYIPGISKPQSAADPVSDFVKKMQMAWEIFFPPKPVVSRC